MQGCDRATRLVEQLLTLSRLEAEGQAAPAQLDLAALVQRVVAEVANQAVAKNQLIEFDADRGVTIAADETLVGVLTRNLLDNAIHYSPSGARIQVSVRRDAGRARLLVEDSGPGLADADLQRLSERFFRVLGSGQSGSGLGWSIVRRIAQVQGAKLRSERGAALGGPGVEAAWPLRTPIPGP